MRKERNTIHIASKVKFNRMKGDSELTIKPSYLVKKVYHSLSATTIRKSKHFCQYF